MAGHGRRRSPAAGHGERPWRQQILHGRHGRALLRRLVRAYEERPAERETIVAEIEQHFRERVAVLVTDSCGFTRGVQSRGIVHMLAFLERLNRLSRAAIERHGGRALHEHADDVVAIFPEAAPAVACAQALLHDLSVANALLRADEEIHISIAIGYGDTLLVSPDEVWGDEMNLACKLGEDLAGRDEILLTPAAHAALGSSSWHFEEVSFRTSGLDLKAYWLRTGSQGGSGG